MYRVYVNGNYKGSFRLPVASANRLDAGYEEQADSLLNGISSNVTPVANFGNLLYHDYASQNWYYWGGFTHCYVDYNKYESFGPGTFPTSFDAKIGPGAGTYGGCDGFFPTSPRSNW